MQIRERFQDFQGFLEKFLMIRTRFLGFRSDFRISRFQQAIIHNISQVYRGRAVAVYLAVRSYSGKISPSPSSRDC